MKKTIIFLTAILSFSACFAQQKGDNVIVVNGVTFEQVVYALLDSGYRITQMDKDFQFLQTAPGGKSDIMYYIRVKDKTAYIQGGTGSYLINNGLFKKYFVDMQKFARQFGNDLKYESL